ncbi:MAG: ATP-binding cassette domain-containing protein [Bacteroidetes bacterium]|nr:ATP-binding cassette domain-containing protein [Bacteroidota bacterium]
MTETILSIENLSKSYGRIRAVDKLNLEVNRGNIFGILGPNGSGKTTTLGIILSVLNPNSGRFTWFGKPNSKYDRFQIGAILESPVFYPYLSAVQNLKIYADIRNVSYDEIDRVLEIVELSQRKNSRFHTYSLGMKQRLAIAAALLGNPRVLILDEPTNGLDPQGIAEIRNLILRIANQGITIILASHLLDEVQKICTHVAVLDKGKNIFTGKVEDVMNASSQVEIRSSDMEQLGNILADINEISTFQREGISYIVRMKDGFDSGALNLVLFQKGLTLTHLAQQKKSLENHFLELLKNNDKTDKN